jgi:transcription elongation GreA/GreB family factor
MDERSRHDRTIRLLETRLEALAAVSERRPRAEQRLDREIVAAVAATRHAVALALISTDEADAVWGSVARRHPHARWCRLGPRLAA